MKNLLTNPAIYQDTNHGQTSMLDLVNLAIAEPLRMQTASFWNVIIQWTSHDDLTEK